MRRPTLPTEVEGVVDVLDLTENERRILLAVVRNPEAHHAEIAEALGMTRESITRAVNREPLRTAIANARKRALEDAIAIYMVYAPVAARSLINIMNAGTCQACGRPPAADRDVVMAVRELNRALEPKGVTTVKFDTPLDVQHHSIGADDLKDLSDEELRVLLAIVQRRAVISDVTAE